MWKVINKSSGIVAYSNSDRGQCMQWYRMNNFTEDGEDLGLYMVTKESIERLVEALKRA